eukprot:scaffold6745_cov38-Attheya_sp.AAC.5
MGMESGIVLAAGTPIAQEETNPSGTRYRRHGVRNKNRSAATVEKATDARQPDLRLYRLETVRHVYQDNQGNHRYVGMSYRRRMEAMPD